MKNLANLKADCVIIRNLSEDHPDNQMYQLEYEKAQRLVQHKERELFCDIKE